MRFRRPKITKKQIGWTVLIICILTTIFIYSFLFFLGVSIPKDFFPWYAVVMFNFTIMLPIFLGIAFFLYLVWWPDHKAKRNVWLKQNGVKFKVKFASVEIDFRVQIQLRHPYYIRAIGVNPVTKEKEEFRSEHIWHNPAGKVPKELTVYVHPKKGYPYYLELPSSK